MDTKRLLSLLLSLGLIAGLTGCPTTPADDDDSAGDDDDASGDDDDDATGDDDDATGDHDDDDDDATGDDDDATPDTFEFLGALETCDATFDTFIVEGPGSGHRRHHLG